ncbi:MAG: hypothetical protein RLZZ299_3006 [Pseudomonadota bacterium]
MLVVVGLACLSGLGVLALAARGEGGVLRAALARTPSSCRTAWGAHAALLRGDVSPACDVALGYSDASRRWLATFARDPAVPDAARARALRILRARAGWVDPDAEARLDADLTAARVQAQGRRRALRRLDASARALLSDPGTSPGLRRQVLSDSGDMQLALLARGIAVHGLYDAAAGLLAASGDPSWVAAAWRARQGVPGTEGAVGVDGASGPPVPRGAPDAAMSWPPPASEMPPPAAAGAHDAVLHALLGPDSEAADHAVEVLAATIRSVRGHDRADRPAWVRAAALHAGVPSGDGDVRAALAGEPATPAARAWLAAVLGEAVGVAVVLGEDAAGVVHVRVGSGTVALADGVSPRAAAAIGGAAAAPDDLLRVDAVRAAVASGRCDPERVGRWLAASRREGAPGVRVQAASAVAARCAVHGPFPEAA